MLPHWSRRLRARAAGLTNGRSVTWQLYDKDSKPASEKGRADGVPVWSLATAFTKPDGNFPHNPEPLPENLKALSKEVRKRKADIGIAVDPDVDRLALVDETGTPIGEDYTLAFAVKAVLDRRRTDGTQGSQLEPSVG